MILFGCGCVRSGGVGGDRVFAGFGICLRVVVVVVVVFRGACGSARVLLLSLQTCPFKLLGN